MTPKSLAAAAVLSLTTVGVSAQTATYNDANGQLTLPSVQVGNTVYSNVLIRLNSFDILGVGGAAPAPTTGTVSAACTMANLTLANYNAIAAGMTLEQVKRTIGCEYTPALTTITTYSITRAWSSGGAVIIVYFDPTGATVQGMFGSPSFKGASGISQ